MASCSLPMLFPPVEIDGGVFCDGGVVMNSPLKPAIDAGAEEIYVIDLTPPPASYQPGTLSLAYHLLSAQFGSALSRDIDYARDRNSHFLAAYEDGRAPTGVLEIPRLERGPGGAVARRTSKYRYLRITVIRPSADLGGLEGFLKFEPESARTLIAAGERDAHWTLAFRREREVVAPDGSRISMLVHGEDTATVPPA
jgi:NTE family protein